jgi:DoxX
VTNNDSTVAATRFRLLGFTPGELILTLARLQLGAWMVVNGLNHWLPIFPQPLSSTPKTSLLLVALIESGLFGLVKAVELFGGVLLLLNLYVPLALVLLLPMSIVVYYFNAVLQGRWNEVLYMGTLCLYLNIILMFAYIRYYLPMLGPKSATGAWADLKRLPGVLRGLD